MKPGTLSFAYGATLMMQSITAVRVLDEKQATRDFVPLSCNENGYTPCRPWSQVFGPSINKSNRLYIPCGECVEMDVSAVNLRGGLDVHGKWLIQDTAVNITATGIFIQGLWEINVGGAKPEIGGTPIVNVIMVGEEEEKFTPILENANACGGANCTIGMKGIVVAGGNVQIRGLADDTPTWLKLYDIVGRRAAPKGIAVDKSVLGHWSVGADILITSHSTKWDDHQVRKIVEITPHEDAQHAVILLDSPIARPTTARESPEYAVEVALLSRNILLMGGPDPVASRGGHFWIMNTPRVPQTLMGVEVRNFGQQGYLGRYPIHLHFCGDSPSTFIVKNTIRESNQRCVVVHGTNKLRVRENVAYDTKGHCFMLEDGMEVENEFMYNLGAQTGAPAIVIPDYGTNGIETDYDPSTFWITNPSNKFVGNVVAGSESSGFWFELLVRGERKHLYPDLNPKRSPLGHFRDNVVHSCLGKAFRTYPSGYIPDEEAVFLGLKAYRNANIGVFFHNSRNLAVVNGHFADNRYSLDIDRSGSVRVQRTEFIGKSASYSRYLNSTGIPNVCRRDNGPVVGVDFHTWKNRPDEEGTTFRNVTFSGFANHPCFKTVPILLDDTTQTGKFDHFSSFRNVVLERDTDPLDFCLAADKGINDVYLTDLSGDTFVESAFEGVSTVVSDDPLMLNFVNAEKCTRNIDRCYSLCNDTCFFTTRFSIDPSETVDYQLRVCRSDPPKSCVWVDGSHRSEDYEFGMRHREFSAHLPTGIYEAEFRDANGERAWPSFVKQTQDTHFCSDEENQEVQLNVPSVQPRDCNDLIKNGDLEASDYDATHWVYRFGSGVQIAQGLGTAGSNAVSGTMEMTRSTLGQYLDNRCFFLMVGAKYKVTARVKLVGWKGSRLVCAVGNRAACPLIGIHTQREGFRNFVKITDEPTVNGFFSFAGEFELDGLYGVNDEVFFYVDSTTPNSQIFIDRVSISLQRKQQADSASSSLAKAKTARPTSAPNVSPTPSPTVRCQNLMTNDDVELGIEGVWSTKGYGTIRSANGMESDTGMRFTDRIFSWNGPSFVGDDLMDYSCLTFGSSWTISAFIKLTDTVTGGGVSCVAGWTCPAIRVAITDASGTYISLQKVSQYVASPWNAHGFNEFKTFVDLPRKNAWDGTIGNVFVDIRDYPVGVDLIVDKFSMRPYSSNRYG